MAGKGAQENAGGQSADEMMAGAAGVVSPEKLSEIRKKVKEESGIEVKKTDPGLETDPEKAAAAKAAAEKAAADEAAGKSTAGKAAPTVEVETAFGKDTYGAVKDGDVKLSSFADVQAFAKDAYKLDIKDVNDFQEILKTLKESQAKAAEADQFKTAAANFENTFKNLPEEIGVLVNAVVNGVDYKPLLNEMVASRDLHYEKEFNAYPELDMVNRYSGKTMNKEEYDALEPTQRDSYKELAKAKYEAARTSYLSAQKEAERTTESTRNAVINSVESAIAKLRSTYPTMGEAQVDKVRQVMTSGLRDSLYTPEGVYKEEAGVKIAMQEFGADALAAQTQTIGQLVEKLRGEGASQANEDLLRRSDKPDAERGRTAEERDNIIAAEVAKRTSFLHGR